jgi:hypothetical protein
MILLGGLVGAGTTTVTTAKASTEGGSLGRFGRVRLSRPLAVVLALAVIVSAALPYLALRYCDLAASAKTLDAVTARAETAAKIDPTSVMPFVVQANAHRFAAQETPVDSPERVAEYEAEAAAWLEATEQEPEYWLYFYNAAVAFLAARDSALTFDAVLADELLRKATTYLGDARRLNPLSPQVTRVEKDLERSDRTKE